MKRLTVSTLLVLLNSLYLYSFSGAGYGTESDPYQITNVQQLQEMDDDRDAHYILMNDIDASDTKNWNVGDHDDDASTPDSAMGFDPIGEIADTMLTGFFKGTFNGRNNTISNLYINRPGFYYVSLFIIADENSSIYDLKLKDIQFSGSSYSAGLVGLNDGASIENITVSGKLEGKMCVGGLVAINRGILKNCHADVQVSGYSQVGGLVGMNERIIINSSASGEVIAQPFNYSYDIGGLVGFNLYVIINTKAGGDVSGQKNVGGLVGRNTANFIYTSLSTGEVTGSESVGGLIGVNEDGSITGCFWDTETSKQAGSAGGTGMTSASLKDINTYLDVGWNFDFIWSMDSDYPEIFIDFSKQPLDTDNNGYVNIDNPVALRWFAESGYDLDKNIELTADIDLNDSKVWNCGLGFMPVGNFCMPFTGKVNGNKFFIRNLYINRPSQNYVGLIGYMTNSTIENLKVVDFNINGYFHIGSVVGYLNYSTAYNLYAEGNVSGEKIVGGLIGSLNTSIIMNSHATIEIQANENNAGGIAGIANYGCICNSRSYGEVKGVGNIGGITGLNYDNKILSSYTYCMVMGNNNVGGIAGIQEHGDDYYHMAYIINSISKGSIIGNKYAGGIIGKNTNGFVSNSYSLSQLSGIDSVGGIAGYNGGTIEGCFWNMEISGISTSEGGEGKSSDEMKQKSMYTDAGWNFDCVWAIDSDYPYYSVNIGLFDTDGNGYYEIATLNDLRIISECAIYLNENLELTDDIDASDSKNWNNSRGFLPIPYFSREFRGNNHTIRNLYSNRPGQTEVGLFARIISSNSLVRDLSMENCELTADYYIGGIAASMYNGIIENSYVNGTFNGETFIGGIVGYNSSANIQNCSADAIIQGTDDLGCIAGFSSSSTIDSCYGKGKVTGNEKLGGLSGYSGGCKISNSQTEAEVTGVRYIGGFIGFAQRESILKCCSNSDVSGDTYVGGLIGEIRSYNTVMNMVCTYGQASGNKYVGGIVGDLYNSYIYNSFSMCDINADSYAGGLAGASSGYIENSYSTGIVIGSDNTGALVGYNSKTVNNSFWDTETSGLDSPVGGAGKTTAEMKTKSTFTDAGWDFNTIWAISPEKNYGYPYFQWMEEIVGVEELPVTEIQLIKAYPNPADNFLHISCPLGFSDKLNVQISDAAGNLVRDMDVVNINNELTVPVVGLSAGAYYMNIISGGEVYSVRFVVE